MMVVHGVLQILVPKGAYVERVLGGFNPPNQILWNAWRFTYLANSLCKWFEANWRFADGR